MSITEAKSWCESDSSKFVAKEHRSNPRFLSLPRPKNQDENDLYFDVFHSQAWADIDEDDRYWLDISEELPATNPRKWVYGDGTPVSWTNWKDGEPNDHGDVGEPLVEVDPNRFWNDVKDTTMHKFLCAYYLPVGAEKTCPWLFDYEDGK